MNEFPADSLKAEQARLLYANLPVSIIFNALLAIILVVVQSDIIPQGRLFGWLAILSVVLLVRTLLAVAWKHGGGITHFTQRWMLYFRLSVIASGMAWGLGTFLLYSSGDVLHQVFIAFVLAGLSAGAISSLAVDRVSAAGFLLSTLVPHLTLLFMEGSRFSLTMGGMIGLYLIYLLLSARQGGTTLHENFKLRIEAVKNEQHLRLSEERLNRAQHTAHIGSWELDLANNQLHWSDEIYRIFEIDQAKFKPSYETFLDSIHPDDRDSVNQAFSDSLANRKPYDIVHRMLFSNGRIKFVRERCTTLFDTEGKPLRAVGTVQDVTEQQLAEITLRESEARYRAVTYTASDAIITADSTGVITSWNRMAEHIFDYAETEAIGQPLTILIPERYRAQHRAGIARLLSGEATKILGRTVELNGLRRDGSEFTMEMSLARWEGGGKQYFTGIIRDISKRKQDEAALMESESRFRFMLETSPIAARITDPATCQVVFANRRYAELINMPPDLVIGISPKQFYAKPQDYSEVTQQVMHGDQITNKLIELTIPGEPPKTKWALASYLALEYEKKPSVLGWFFDITDRKEMEEKVHHLAYHDQLTGLPNRTLFNDRLRQALAVAKRDATKLAMMFIDLDKFKPVNDTQGHDVGDRLLKNVASRIRQCIRESDTVGRIGGDEFVVLLPKIVKVKDATVVAEKIRDSLNQPFELDGQRLDISASIGIAIYPEHGGDEKQLIKNADIAMYCAKSKGGNNEKTYHSGMHGKSD